MVYRRRLPIRRVIRLAKTLEGHGPFFSQLRQAVVGLALLFLFFRSLARLGIEPATQITNQQIEPAVAAPVHHARLDPQSPVGRPTAVVAAPAHWALGD